MLDHATPGQTRVETVIAAIRLRIDSRRLAPGARIPSVRDLAAGMGVSKSTVVEAYDRLIAEGAIVARRGSGFYVAGATRPLSLQALGPQLDRAIDPLWLTRQSLDAGPRVLKPGSGWLPSAFMPDESLRKSLRHVARLPSAEMLTQYDIPLGYAPLRHTLAVRLGERGITADPQQIMLTDSASQSLDILCRFLLEPGDTVLVDDPCYFNFHAVLRAHRAKVVGVPYGVDGPDVEAFAEVLATQRPRLYMTISGLHNPTGASLSAIKAHRVLKLAEKHDVVIIEDDVFADLEDEPAPRLAGFDGFDRVIQVGSFSKTVSQALRCGYIAARPDWIEPLVDLKLTMSLGNGHLAPAVLHRLLTDGSYRRHLDGLRAKLAGAMSSTIRRLGEIGLEPFLEPRAGLFLWAELPEGLDAADIARAALARDVIVAPGNVFSAGQRASRFLRFNVARCGEPRIYEVLADAMREASSLDGRHEAIAR